MHKGILYTIVFILAISLLFSSCSTPSSISKSKDKSEAKLEIIKRLEYPGDSDYFASSESELSPNIDLPHWNIPELMTIEEYDTYVKIASSDRIIREARSFNGTPYKFGGTTNKGMDCSGLVYTAFKSENIYLPRVSSDMAREGERIKLENAQPGDLLFFKTSRQNRINHVGIVVKSNNKEVLFIHSSTSRGVITSSINEAYWQRAFSEARRIL